MRVGVKPSGQNFTCCRAAKAPGKKVCGKSKKVVDKDTLFGYNIPCQQRRAAPDKPNNGDLHSGSAVDSDSTCGSSILSSPTRKPQSQLAAVFSGHSAVGSAPRSGRGGRGFKSRCSDQKRPVHFVYWSFLISAAGFAAEATAACGGNREPRLGQRSARRECRSRHEADAGQPQPGTGRPCHRRGNQKPSGLLISARVPPGRNGYRGACCRSSGI